MDERNYFGGYSGAVLFGFPHDGTYGVYASTRIERKMRYGDDTLCVVPLSDPTLMTRLTEEEATELYDILVAPMKNFPLLNVEDIDGVSIRTSELCQQCSLNDLNTQPIYVDYINLYKYSVGRRLGILVSKDTSNEDLVLTINNQIDIVCKNRPSASAVYSEILKYQRYACNFETTCMNNLRFGIDVTGVFEVLSTAQKMGDVKSFLQTSTSIYAYLENKQHYLQLELRMPTYAEYINADDPFYDFRLSIVASPLIAHEIGLYSADMNTDPFYKLRLSKERRAVEQFIVYNGSDSNFFKKLYAAILKFE